MDVRGWENSHIEYDKKRKGDALYRLTNYIAGLRPNARKKEIMNKIELMGRLTKDVEKRQTKNKTEVGAFTLAVPRKADKETTDFIDCVVFGKLVDIITKYTSKGDRLIVCGSLNINNYQDKDGNNRKSFYIVVDDFYFVENKKLTEENELPFE